MVGHGETADEARPRHGVVHEAAGEQLARSVVDRLLGKDVARALRDAALHLAFDDLVIDDVADVVAGDVGDDLGLARLGIDLHLGDMAAVREGTGHFRTLLVIEVQLAFEFTRKIFYFHLAIRAFDSVTAGNKFNICLRALKVFRRERHAVFHDLLRGEEHRAAQAMQCARAAGRVGDQVVAGLGGAQADLLHRDAEHAGDDLRERGFVTLSVVMRCRAQGDAARIFPFRVPGHVRLVVGREAAGRRHLDVAGDAAATQFAFRSRFFSSLFKAVPLRSGKSLVHDPFKISAVVFKTADQLVRHLRLRDHVAAAELRRIEP